MPIFIYFRNILITNLFSAKLKFDNLFLFPQILVNIWLIKFESWQPPKNLPSYILFPLFMAAPLNLIEFSQFNFIHFVIYQINLRNKKFKNCKVIIIKTFEKFCSRSSAKDCCFKMLGSSIWICFSIAQIVNIRYNDVQFIEECYF